MFLNLLHIDALCDGTENLLQAVKYIEYDSAFGEEEKKLAKTLKVACNLNNAACKLKLKDYKEAEKLSTKVHYSFFSPLESLT